MTTKEYYNLNADVFFKETVNLDMEDIYEPFLELIPKGGKILDAGCGSGRDSLYFKRKGYLVTAFDYSEELVRMASKLIEDNVLHMSFEEINFEEEYDGIWACASLIHVSKEQIDGVMTRLNRALKQNGIIYASFKYGDGEELRKGRFFNDYNENTANSLIKDFSSFSIIKHWKTEDLRKERKNEYWLNLIIQKK